MTGATTELGPCQVRSATDRPCSRPAVLEIWGVPFCERCAREQEAYFAIGELTQGLAADREKQARGLRDESLVGMLRQIRLANCQAHRRNKVPGDGEVESVIPKARCEAP